MMGSGKTTVGARVAERLGWPFVDSDADVEARTGRTVREIFEAEGEAAYRVLESEVLAAALARSEPAVIAAAGGAVLDPANRDRIRAAGVVVWLQADPEVLAARVGGADHRPLLADDPAGTLARLAEARQPLYGAVADVVVGVAGRSVDEIVAEVAALAVGDGVNRR
ncbi:MAG: shikimate kinase [Acidimicrobiales bacterium]|nr:shikimate kinase [Acidimicrobiales bacterium]